MYGYAVFRVISFLGISRNIRQIIFAVIALCLCSSLRTYGGDIAWNIAPSHFDGVDNQGNVFLFFPLGIIELTSGFHLPLYATFDSGSENRSPFAGYGWSIPLLETKFIQVNENQYRWIMPNGESRWFTRDKKQPTVLKSRGGWDAQLRDNTIVLKSRYGSQLAFFNGRIMAMKIEAGEFYFRYRGNELEGIVDHGQLVLKVERDQHTHEVTGFTLLHDKTIRFEQRTRPRFQVMQNAAKVSGDEMALGKFTLPNGDAYSIEYGSDKHSNAWLRIMDFQNHHSDQLITWDSKTGAVIQDGDWNYKITPSRYPGGNAAILRVNSKQQSEFWHRDDVQGREIIQGTDGIKRIRTWFTSGILRGRPRAEMNEVNGHEKTVRKYSYDEKGRLIRVIEGQDTYILVYQDDGRMAAMLFNGKIIRVYTENGKALGEQYVKEEVPHDSTR